MRKWHARVAVPVNFATIYFLSISLSCLSVVRTHFFPSVVLFVSLSLPSSSHPELLSLFDFFVSFSLPSLVAKLDVPIFSLWLQVKSRLF